MYYKEYLSLRRPFIVFIATMFVLGLLALFSIHAPSGSTTISVSQMMLFANAWFVAIFATVCGTSIGQECGDAARLALVRPITRLRSVTTIFAMGIAAIFLATIVGFAAIVLPTAIMGGHIVDAGRYGWFSITFPLSFALALYGGAACASVFSRRTQLVAVLVAPLAAALYVAGFAPGLGVVLRWVNLLNPLSYYIPGINILANPSLAGHSYGFFGTLSPAIDVLVLFGMFALCVIVAGVRFQHVEV
jgi:hypothetical protein